MDKISIINLIATIVVAVATIVYTAGTFLLWKTSVDNLKAMQNQINLIGLQLEHQVKFNKTFAQWTALDAHRDIWLPIISDQELTNLLLVDAPTPEKTVAAEFLGSILINHCYRIYINFHNEIFDESEFTAFTRDARNLFSYPLVRWRWKKVVKYHSSDFIKFIHDNVIS